MGLEVKYLNIGEQLWSNRFRFVPFGSKSVPYQGAAYMSPKSIPVHTSVYKNVWLKEKDENLQTDKVTYTVVCFSTRYLVSMLH